MNFLECKFPLVFERTVFQALRMTAFVGKQDILVGLHFKNTFSERVFLPMWALEQEDVLANNLYSFYTSEKAFTQKWRLLTWLHFFKWHILDIVDVFKRCIWELDRTLK